MALDGAGILPGIGIVANALNTAISLSRGDFMGAGLNALAMIPIVGQGVKALDKAADAAKAADKAFDAAKRTGKGPFGYPSGTRQATDVVDDVIPSRQLGDRMTSRDNALQQLREIEEAQRKVRQGKSKQIIDSIEKSRQRAKNQLKDIANDPDLLDDFD